MLIDDGVAIEWMGWAFSVHIWVTATFRLYEFMKSYTADGMGNVCRCLVGTHNYDFMTRNT